MKSKTTEKKKKVIKIEKENVWIKSIGYKLNAFGFVFGLKFNKMKKKSKNLAKCKLFRKGHNSQCILTMQIH